MALTKDNIDRANEILTSIENLNNSIPDILSSSTSQLQSDNNYQIFVEGTEKGNVLNQRLTKLVNVLQGLSEEQLKNLTIHCKAFLTTQEELNKQ